MKIERFLLFAVVVGTVACRGNDKAVRKDQQYEVVQEGQASGVTSTINAPGETAAVVTPPITGTGADTTTAFNSTPGIMSTAGAQAGSLAGTLPPPMTSSAPVPRPRRQPRPPQTDTEPAPAEPRTTTADQAPPPPTDTSSTTSTEPPPPPPPPPPV
ncbi:MAG TPA: hypothetical protein VF381_01610 [Thermoanaerobaculia bacterium]